MTRHIVLPDCQVKPGADLSYLRAIGNYIAEKKPDSIINIGDFADMPSLSSYDIGKKSFEGRTYKADVEATREAMRVLMDPIMGKIERIRLNKKKQWNPNLVLTLGNHEHRIDRAIEYDRKLEGLISVDDLKYEEWGWNVIPFLEPINIDGVLYAHYFTSGVMGRPVTTARQLLLKKHMSCIAGHQQGRDVSYDKRGDGKQVTAIIAGSCYPHDEGYMDHQSNRHWRGIVVLNQVDDGQFDEMFVSLDYLMRKYDN